MRDDPSPVRLAPIVRMPAPVDNALLPSLKLTDPAPPVPVIVPPVNVGLSVVAIPMAIFISARVRVLVVPVLTSCTMNKSPLALVAPVSEGIVMIGVVSVISYPVTYSRRRSSFTVPSSKELASLNRSRTFVTTFAAANLNAMEFVVVVADAVIVLKVDISAVAK